MKFLDFVACILFSIAVFSGLGLVYNHPIAAAIIIGAVLVSAVLAICSVRVIRWYICWLMAQFDFVYTEVPEGRFKIVTRFGGHRKTLLNKKGHNIAPADDPDKGILKGDIVKLESGEEAAESRLFLIGWPGIDRIFSTKMEFLKSLPNGGVESHDKESEDTFYAKVDYNYAVPFVDCEDKNNLPLIGYATLLANVTGPEKSLFQTKNFYETMIGLILPSIRECLRGYGYDDFQGEGAKVKKDELDEIIWKALEEPNPRGRDGKDGLKMSVKDQLYEDYGVVIINLRIVDIDPADEELRKLTLIRYKAERQADAAQAVRRREALEAAGSIILAMDEWVEGQKQDGETAAQAKERLVKCGAYAKHETTVKDLILAHRGNLQVARNEFGSPDGSPLPSGLQYLSVGGGGAGVLFSGKRNPQISEEQKSEGKASANNPYSKALTKEDVEDAVKKL